MQTITSAVLLLDEQQCLANIQAMKAKADRHNLILKPHCKTHQSAFIADWMRKEGITSITVSSIKMAEYFAGNDWDDITIAIPVNILEAPKINALAESISLSLLVDQPQVVVKLREALTRRVSIYIEIDTGSGRTGIPFHQTARIQEVIAKIKQSPLLILKGFYSHPGHSYDCRSKSEIKTLYTDVLAGMKRLKETFKVQTICIGDTPCCSTQENFAGVDEISPGNFVFFDLMQQQIGACAFEQIAVALACPVIATYPDRREVVVHAGAVHLSKEFLTENGQKHFGKVIKIGNESWSLPVPGAHVKAISQEHGIIRYPENDEPLPETGDIIGILPVHSCLTANLMAGYTLLDRTEIEHLHGRQHRI